MRDWQWYIYNDSILSMFILKYGIKVNVVVARKRAPAVPCLNVS